MVRVEEIIEAAIRELQSGRPREAEAALREILLTQPGEPRALAALGQVLSKTGRIDESISVLWAAVRADPGRVEYRHTLGIALRKAKRSAEAADMLAEAVQAHPGSAELHASLGGALDDAGRVGDAVAAYQRAIELRPEHAPTYNNLGRVLARQGDWDAAVTAYQTAVSHNANLPQVFNNLGNALRRVRRYGEAEVALRRALSLSPGYGEAHCNLGVVYKDMGRHEQAEAEYRRAIALMPEAAEAWSDLGIVLAEQERFDEAQDAYETALQLKPSLVQAFNHLGLMYRKLGRLSDALGALTRAAAADPGNPEAAVNLANVLHDSGRAGEAIPLYEKLVGETPGNAAAWSNLLLSLNYVDGVGAVEVAERHREFGQWFDRDDGARFDNDRTPDRVLRVAYLSPDFRRHSVASFVEPVLAGHDRGQVRVYCYSDVKRPDDATRRFGEYADEWRDTSGLSDAELTDMAGHDAIDILVDLAGHGDGNRLPALGRRIAPVQVSYLGYPNTTGLAAVDYRLTDAVADPEGMTESFYTEELVRLPGCVLCYQPPVDAPPVAPSPAETRGHVTFGSFNNSAKITPATIAIWARILSAVWTSRMVIKSVHLADDGLRADLVARFARHGIAADRIDVRGPDEDRPAHLARYGDVDVALDTFPYTGAATTCEALWMGVPVVTLAGATHASRVGASILTGVGLSQLVARSVEDYAKRAVALASDVGRLGRLRADLRGIVSASPLTDRATFVPALESAYRQMWHRWCQAPVTYPGGTPTSVNPPAWPVG